MSDPIISPKSSHTIKTSNVVFAAAAAEILSVSEEEESLPPHLIDRPASTEMSAASQLRGADIAEEGDFEPSAGGRARTEREASETIVNDSSFVTCAEDEEARETSPDEETTQEEKE